MFILHALLFVFFSSSWCQGLAVVLPKLFKLSKNTTKIGPCRTFKYMSIVDDKTYPRLTANQYRPYHSLKKKTKSRPESSTSLVFLKLKTFIDVSLKMSTLVAKEHSQAYSNGHARSSEVGKGILLLWSDAPQEYLKRSVFYED